ncbi:MAG: hypothetical protein C4294_18120 [Nitrospiraceae bacterium]
MSEESIKYKELEHLFNLPNVLGFSQKIQERIKGGVVIKDTQVIRVYVKKKVPAAMLAPHELIPKQICTGSGCFETDVVEIGELTAMQCQTRTRPVKPGCSLGHYRITAGTTGWLVEAHGNTHILSNLHVLSDDVLNPRADDPILQPGPYDGGRHPGDLVAKLMHFVPLKRDEPNEIDAALAVLTDERFGMPLPVKSAPRDLRKGETGNYCGRTSGCVTVDVTDDSATVDVCYNPPSCSVVLRFVDQIMYTVRNQGGPRGGDSGSLIFNAEGGAGGLLFAGSPTAGVACKISNVLKHLPHQYFVIDLCR